MSEATRELVRVAYLLRDLKVPIHCLVTLAFDNKAAQYIAANPIFHNITKHMDADCHSVRDKLKDGFLQTARFPSAAKCRHIQQAFNSAATTVYCF